MLCGIAIELLGRAANEISDLRQRQLTQSAAVYVRDNISNDNLTTSCGGAISSQRLHQVASRSRVRHQKGANTNGFVAGSGCFA
jgi:hypothetical protein